MEEKKTHVIFMYRKDDGEFHHFQIIENKTDKEIEDALDKVKDEMIYRYKWIKDQDVIKAFLMKPKTTPIEDIKDEIIEKIDNLKRAVERLEQEVNS
jgi:hypothetical protein